MKKIYNVLTKKGNSFTIEAFNLKDAKRVASFNCRHNNEKVDRVYLKNINQLKTKSHEQQYI